MIINLNGIKAIRFALNFFAPKLMTLFRIKIVDACVENFIKTMVQQTLDYREQNNVYRNDFFQLMLQLRNIGAVRLDDEWQTEIKHEKKMSLMEIAAQAIVFFGAAVETSSMTMIFTVRIGKKSNHSGTIERRNRSRFGKAWRQNYIWINRRDEIHGFLHR